MTDSAAIIQQLVSAVNTVHTPLIPPQQRAQAQEICDNMKDSPMCFDCGTYLAKTENTDVVRHFGLHMLEHMIRSKWYTFTKQQKDAMKKYCLELLAGGTKDMMIEKRFIKEKVVTLIVEIAKRDWPQQWEDMLNALVQIASIADTQAELVLMTFGTLPDEIKVYNDTTTTTSTSTLSEQRKKDLMAGISMGLQFLFSFFYNTLETNYRKYMENKTQNPEIAKRSLHFVLAVLQALISYLEWAPLSMILDSKFHVAFCMLLSEPPTRLTSVECLLLLLSRKSGVYHEKLKLLFPFDNLDTFSNAMNTTTSNQQEDYTFHKRLGQTLTLLGTELIKTSPNKERIPQSFEKYLQIMLAFTNHPSLLMSSFTLPFWKLCVENATIQQLPYFPPFYGQLMQMCVNKLIKTGDPEKEKSDIARYSRIDFETSSEYNKFQGFFRSKVVEFVRALATTQPDLCLEFAGSRLQQITSTPIAPEHAEQASLLFEALAQFLSAVLTGLPHDIFTDDNSTKTEQAGIEPVENVTKQKSIQYIENLLQLLLAYNPEHTLTIRCQLICLQSFVAYYAKYSQSLQYVLTKIMPLIVYRQPNEPIGQLILSQETMDVRRRALSTLVNLASHVTSPLLAFLPQLMNQAQQYESQNLMLDKEKSLFLEALVIISNGMKNYQQQSAFLSNLIAPYVAIWTSQEISSAVESAQALLTYIGVFHDGTTVQAVYEERRRKLQFLLSVFGVAYKRGSVPIDTQEIEEGAFGPFIAHGLSFSARWPISQHNRTILPNIMALMKTIHSIWDPAVRNMIPQEFNPIFTMDETAIFIYMGGDPAKVPKPGRDYVRYIRGLIEAARETGYHIVGFAAMHGDEFFSINSLASILLCSVFSQLEFMENRHLKMLIKNFVEMFVHHCPEKLHATLLDPLLPSLFTAVFNHLNSSWLAYLSRVNITTPGAEKVEIVEDKILHDLTSEYLDLLQRYILTFAHVLATPAIVFPMVYCIFGCLSWTDGLIRKRAAQMCLKLVPLLIEDPQYHKLVGGEMLMTTIKALAENNNPTNPSEGVSQDLLALITDIYVHMRLISDIPKSVLLSLPNINESIITSLNQQLRNATDSKSQRNIFQRLLQDISGMNIKNIKQATILDLPQKLFVDTVSGGKFSSRPWVEDIPALNLASLYDSHVD